MKGLLRFEVSLYCLTGPVAMGIIMRNMDFLTQKTLTAGDPHLQLSRWLRATLAALAAFGPSDELWPGGGGQGDRQGEKTVKPSQRHGSALHSHGYTEIGVCVGGRALIEVENRVYRMRAPSVLFALPGTPHCQARTTDAAFHALSWLVFSRKAMLVVSSVHRPGVGWSSGRGTSVEGEDVRELAAMLSDPAEEPSRRRVERIRARLLEAINRAYQQAARRAGREEGAAEGATAYHRPVLKYVRSYIEDNLSGKITLKELGQMARLSPNYLNRLFKEWEGEPIHQYTIRRRMEEARRLLREGELLVKQVARRVGYDDPLYFSRAFHDYYGRWPSRVGSDGRPSE